MAMEWQENEIISRQDGSYVIVRNGRPYHVPFNDEFAELWRQVYDYALTHPDKVTVESSPPPPTPEQIQSQLIAAITQAIQDRLDEFARTRMYDGILSACSYATSTDSKFRAEGEYCVRSRDASWAKAYELLAEVESGAHAPYSVDEVLALMPALEWPL